MAIIAAVLTTWQHRAWDAEKPSLPERISAALVAPAQTYLTVGFTKVHDAGLAIAAAPRLAEENRHLREQRDELEAEQVLAVDILLQNKAMLEKLGFERDKPLEHVPARVIARSSGRTERWVKVRAAGGRPLEVGNVVREAKGLVGRVVWSQGDVARVVLLVDPHHAVRGKDLETGDEGMVHAADELEAGPNRLRLEKTRRGARIRANDTIVTSGIGETYPGGIRVGVVESVQRSRASISSLTAYIKPSVDFEHLDYVYVLRAGES